MQSKCKALRLTDLREMSDKAKALWDYFVFYYVAEPKALMREV
jgi:hypothetical protein